MQESKEDCDVSQIREGRDTADSGSFRSSAPNLSIPELDAREDPYESTKYLDDLVKDMRTLDAIQMAHPEKLRNTYSLLVNEIDRVWAIIYMRTQQDDKVYYLQQQKARGTFVTIHEKILIPENPNCKFIGRILGPRGISVKQLEAKTHCRILIRGKGSIKDPHREARLRSRVGWEHLSEPLHVLVTATDISHDRCVRKLACGVQCIKTLLSTNNDEHKRIQLIQLAIINGTYRPTRARC
ncbi:unnamed protein product [Litomosoides sigmodontis]|uniref:K Homology domain-containing protein n=1 Tax=Litomosoides sigmodontis TaxID=42156 RepID=A0A3P6TCV2_LITSI|nr:unnamed protein product [Litomosoides sigmodontis]